MKKLFVFSLILALTPFLTTCGPFPPFEDDYGMVVDQRERFGYRGGASPRHDQRERTNRPPRERRDSGSRRTGTGRGAGTDPDLGSDEPRIVKPKSDGPKPDIKPTIVESKPDPAPKIDQPKVDEPKPARNDYPTADPVPNKSGVVFSPYVDGKKVSIEGFKPGDLAECPWSGKPFRVP